MKVRPMGEQTGAEISGVDVRRLSLLGAGKIVANDGLKEAPSDEIIDELETYMVQPRAMYTHRLRLGDVVIRDDRCSYHKAAGDDPPEETASTGGSRSMLIA